jgi:hypothetical protein
MKVFIDRQKVEARAMLSNLASVGGLVLLLASVVIPLFLPAWAGFAYMFMIVGMGVSMVGIYFANRWVRKPRPEESLDRALKSFDDQYRLYHYPSLPCDHLLLTPSGVIILEPFNLSGSFSYRQSRWKEAMTIGRALRYIVEEHVGDPIALARQVEEELDRRIKKEFGLEVTIPIKSVVVFTHPAVNLDVEESPIPICKIDKLKKQVTLNAPRLALEQYEKLSSFLESQIDRRNIPAFF